MALIELKNVEFSYADVPVVGPISIEWASGQIVSIMGPSGCGKSTLFRLIGGLERPTRGACILDELPVERPSPCMRFSFQDYDAFPWRTVKENLILSGAQEKGDGTAFTIDKLLEKIGLSGHERKYPAELSGGMRKRLALGRCLAGKPKVILLDEPFSSLDVYARYELYGVLQALWRELRCLILIITHDLHEAIALSHRIIVSTCLPFRIRREIEVPFDYPRTESISLSNEYLTIARMIREPLQVDCEDSS